MTEQRQQEIKHALSLAAQYFAKAVGEPVPFTFIAAVGDGECATASNLTHESACTLAAWQINGKSAGRHTVAPS
jgi:hypothetical protein